MYNKMVYIFLFISFQQIVFCAEAPVYKGNPLTIFFKEVNPAKICLGMYTSPPSTYQKYTQLHLVLYPNKDNANYIDVPGGEKAIYNQYNPLRYIFKKGNNVYDICINNTIVAQVKENIFDELLQKTHKCNIRLYYFLDNTQLDHYRSKIAVAASFKNLLLLLGNGIFKLGQTDDLSCEQSSSRRGYFNVAEMTDSEYRQCMSKNYNLYSKSSKTDEPPSKDLYLKGKEDKRSSDNSDDNLLLRVNCLEQKSDDTLRTLRYHKIGISFLTVVVIFLLIDKFYGLHVLHS
jgi:hypothetical protein